MLIVSKLEYIILIICVIFICGCNQQDKDKNLKRNDITKEYNAKKYSELMEYKRFCIKAIDDCEKSIMDYHLSITKYRTSLMDTAIETQNNELMKYAEVGNDDNHIKEIKNFISLEEKNLKEYKSQLRSIEDELYKIK